MSIAPLTRKELDRMATGRCSIRSCTHEQHGVTYLHQSCHTGAGVTVRYEAALGALRLECRTCERLIAVIAVAP